MADGHLTRGAGNKLVESDSMMNQPLSPEDERIVSTNPSPDAAITGPSRNAIEPPRSSDAVADNNAIYPLNSYGSLEQTYFYGGYDSGASSWGGYPQYGAEGLHVVPPVIYGESPSLGLHSPYGYNSQMAYGQYSPVSTPVPQLMVDNQLYSPQQIPVSPQYYPQPVGSSMPHMSAAIPVSHAEMVTPKGHMSMNAQHNHGYYSLHGVFGSGEPLSSPSNSSDAGWRTLSSNAGYTQPVGTYGSFDPSVGQIAPQRTFHGYGMGSDFVGAPYPYDGSFQSIYTGGMPNSQPVANYRNRLNMEKVRTQREQDSMFVISGDRNRGPRATKGKGKGTTGNGSLPGTESPTENNSVAASAKIDASASGVNHASYNSAEFPTEYETAKFFIIKSFSEDNIHRSIKYGVWASTPHGNRKLDAAYHEAKEKGNCPIFLLFSVNASGQFCGVAEMAGPVDFEKSADYWQQDRWTGQFAVRWHIIKDVPNIKFRQIELENNDNKPVTHSRDSQEVKLEQGIEMLKIFKEYDAQTSIMDDFEFYDEREKVLQERKNRQQAKPKSGASEPPTDEILNNISDRLDQTLHLEESCKDVVTPEKSSSPQQSSTV